MHLLLVFTVLFTKLISCLIYIVVAEPITAATGVDDVVNPVITPTAPPPTVAEAVAPAALPTDTLSVVPPDIGSAVSDNDIAAAAEEPTTKVTSPATETPTAVGPDHVHLDQGSVPSNDAAGGEIGVASQGSTAGEWRLID